MRSHWEVIYAKYLDFQRVSWSYEPKGFKLKDSYYFPDFYIKDVNEWHEVKGYMDLLSKKKIDEFQSFYPREKLVIIDGNYINEIKNRSMKCLEKV